MDKSEVDAKDSFLIQSQHLFAHHLQSIMPQPKMHIPLYLFYQSRDYQWLWRNQPARTPIESACFTCVFTGWIIYIYIKWKQNKIIYNSFLSVRERYFTFSQPMYRLWAWRGWSVIKAIKEKKWTNHTRSCVAPCFRLLLRNLVST